MRRVKLCVEEVPVRLDLTVFLALVQKVNGQVDSDWSDFRWNAFILLCGMRFPAHPPLQMLDAQAQVPGSPARSFSSLTKKHRGCHVVHKDSTRIVLTFLPLVLTKKRIESIPNHQAFHRLQ